MTESAAATNGASLPAARTNDASDGTTAGAAPGTNGAAGADSDRHVTVAGAGPAPDDAAAAGVDPDDATAAGVRPEGAHPVVCDRLLAAATRLFADRGFERTSVQDLVDAAGVTKGAMYHYFASKEDVLFAVFRRVLATQMRNLDACATDEGPVHERLRAAAVDLVVSTVENLDDMVIYFRSLHVLSRERQDQVRAERQNYQERFRALIEEGQRQRVFRTDVVADLVASQYFGAVNHLGMWYHPDGELGGDEVGGYFADLLLTGLRPE